MAQIIPRAELRADPYVLSYPPPPAPEVASAGLRESGPPAASSEPADAAPALAEEPPAIALEALRKQAFEDGYRDGYESGARQAKEELAGQASALARLLGSAQEALAGEIGGLEEVAVEIAYAAVCRVLGAAAGSEEAVRAMARQALEEVRSREKVRVRVSAADHALLAGLASPLPGELLADERVAAGGCIIESAGGLLDARLEVQLRQLLVALTRVRNGHAG